MAPRLGSQLTSEFPPRRWGCCLPRFLQYTRPKGSPVILLANIESGFMCFLLSASVPRNTIMRTSVSRTSRKHRFLVRDVHHQKTAKDQKTTPVGSSFTEEAQTDFETLDWFSLQKRDSFLGDSPFQQGKSLQRLMSHVDSMTEPKGVEGRWHGRFMFVARLLNAYPFPLWVLSKAVWYGGGGWLRQ